MSTDPDPDPTAPAPAAPAAPARSNGSNGSRRPPPTPTRARKRFSLDALPWVTLTPSSSSEPPRCLYAPPAPRPRVRRAAHPLVKGYLLAFNAVSAAAWGYLLYLTVWFVVTPRSAAEAAASPRVTVLGQGAHGAAPARWAAALGDHLSGAYDFHGLGHATKYVQTLAVMEVVHAALGLVRSPVGTVASQVASRLWAVWGVVEMCPSVSD